jgi:hypothetical protein
VFQPEPYGGTALASVDGVEPIVLFRYDRDGEVVQSFSFSSNRAFGGRYYHAYPGGMVSHGSDLFFSTAIWDRDAPASLCARIPMITGINNDEGLRSEPMLYQDPLVDGRNMAALAVTHLRHDSCGDEEECDLLVSSSAGCTGRNGGIALHSLNDGDVLRDEWIPFDGPAGATDAFRLSEFIFAGEGRWAFVVIEHPEVEVRSVDLATGDQGGTLLGECFDPGDDVTVTDMTHNAASERAGGDFPVYLAVGANVLRTRINRSGVSAETPDVLRLTAGARRVIDINGELYIATEGGSIFRFIPDDDLFDLCE